MTAVVWLLRLLFSVGGKIDQMSRNPNPVPEHVYPDWVKGRSQCVTSISSEPEYQSGVQGHNLVPPPEARRRIRHYVEDLEFDEFRLCPVGQ